MKKSLFTLLLLLAAAPLLRAACEVPQRKIIDGGGSGPHPAEARSESSLPGFVVYRPQDLHKAVAAQGALPVVVFANGGCNDTSLPHERLLNDLASHGYVVIALGAMQLEPDDRPLGKSPNEDMIRALDWITERNDEPASGYYRCIAPDKAAFAGQSCGGAQVLATCADPRVKTCILLNSGMGDMQMAGASAASLGELHQPVLYIAGGEGDIAYRNALADYARIDRVPVALANQLCVGHGGTFHEPYGGSFSVMVRHWLDWQFKEKPGSLDVFTGNRLEEFPDWTMQAKNFPGIADNTPFHTREIHCRSREGKDIWGMAYIPNTAGVRKPLVVMAHGYNSTHQEPQPYAECLAMRGVASYVFDFCGGGNRSRSEGRTTEMTLFTEQADIEDIVREIKTWEFVDTARLALLGCSQGGLVAALTAAARPDLFRALVLVYPALTIPQTAPRMLATADAAPGRPLEVMGMQLGRGYYEAILGLDVPGTIGAYRGDTFIVYGDADPIAAGGTIEQTRSRYPRCETLVIPTGRHGFPDYRNHTQASRGIVDFILRSLAGE